MFADGFIHLYTCRPVPPRSSVPSFSFHGRLQAALSGLPPLWELRVQEPSAREAHAAGGTGVGVGSTDPAPQLRASALALHWARAAQSPPPDRLPESTSDRPGAAFGAEDGPGAWAL